MTSESRFHKVALDLGRRSSTPVTIDGFPLKYVTDVNVEAPATGHVVVTVSFLAEVVTDGSLSEQTSAVFRGGDIESAFNAAVLPRLATLEGDMSG